MKSYKNYLMKAVLALMLITTACDEDDTNLTPIEINFTNTEIGVTSSTEVSVTFSRAAATDGFLTLEIVSPTLIYGSDADYYTTPAMVSDEIVLDYEAGSESLSFTIHAGSGLNIQDDESITLILSDSDELATGTDMSALVKFSENFLAKEGTVIINGGGDEFPNQSFIDLSKLNQTTVDKYTWDLGFSSTASTHNVVLNASAKVMARPLDKTDIDQVTSADTVGFASKMYLSNYVDTEASGWIDNQNGDLSDTAFGDIFSTDSDNKVFIIKRDGNGRDWKKVRVLQNDDNYTLQYADINATTHTEVTITKDQAYNFNFFDLDNGEVSVQPEKENWDLMYSSYSGRANFGQLLAISYNDYIVINRSNVKAAKISTDDFTYDEFSASDAASATLISDDISVIGSSWRTLVNFNLVLDESVFYVITDSGNNMYKLQFTNLTSENGERGYPEFKIELL